MNKTQQAPQNDWPSIAADIERQFKEQLEEHRLKRLAQAEAERKEVENLFSVG